MNEENANKIFRPLTRFIGPKIRLKFLIGKLSEKMVQFA